MQVTVLNLKIDSINSYLVALHFCRCTTFKLVCTAALVGTLPYNHWWIRSCSVTNQIDRFSCKKGSSGFSSRIHFLSSRLPVM